WGKHEKEQSKGSSEDHILQHNFKSSGLWQVIKFKDCGKNIEVEQQHKSPHQVIICHPEIIKPEDDPNQGERKQHHDIVHKAKQYLTFRNIKMDEGLLRHLGLLMG